MSNSNSEIKTIDQKTIIKKAIFTVLIMGGFLILRNFPPSGLDQPGWDGLLVLFVAVMFWLTEAIPMAIAAVFTLFLGNWIGGYAPQADILAGFSSTGVFFLMGAMIIGQVFAKCGLGHRLSLYILPLFGNKSKMVLLSVMLGTSVMSMFLADIPTALVFFGLCSPLLEKNECVPGQSKFGKALMIGIVVGAALGGMGTPAGSGMNAATMSILKSISGVEVSFAQWSIIGVPVALVSTVLAWAFLCFVFKPEIDIVKGLDTLKDDRKNVGPLRGPELKFTIVFGLMIILWFFPKILGIDMYTIAWTGIFVMALPGMNLIDWKEISGRMDWSAVLVCGAATALSVIVSNLGTGVWLSGILSDLFLSSAAEMGLLVLIIVINVMMMVGHYPMPQGVSLAALCLPVVVALASTTGMNVLALALPVCMSTSMLLLVPIDPTCFTTLPGGYWKLKDMMWTGVFITIGYIVVASIWTATAAGMGLLG